MECSTESGNLAANLPPELLSNIFSRLRLSDVKICRMVCRSWGYSASRQMAEMSYFDFRGQDDNPESLPSCASQKIIASPMSLEAIKSLVIRKICIAFSNDSIASRWGLGPLMKQLVSLKLYKCKVTEEDFVRILTHCIEGYREDERDEVEKSDILNDKDYEREQATRKLSNLKSLELIDSLQSDYSSALQEPKAHRIVSRALSNLTKLDISGNKSMTDDIFSSLTSCSPNIETLVVDKISIQYHPGIYKKYYPELNPSHVHDIKGEDTNSISPFKSPYLFTFGCVLYYVRCMAQKITNLSLQGTDLPDNLLQRLAIIGNLKLATLDISKNLGIKLLGMNHLAHNQGSHLKELNISMCRRIGMDYDPNLVQIFKNLSGLKKLILKGMSFPRGLDECLIYLPTLEYLDTTGSDFPTKHLADGIVKPLEDAQVSDGNVHESHLSKDDGMYSQHRKESSCAINLRVLILSRYCKAPEQFARIVKWTPNLVDLNFENCTLTDEVLQQIFEALENSNLSCLNLNGCEGVTGAGFMGQKLPENNQSDPVNPLIHSDTEYNHINLVNKHLKGSIGSLRKITKLQVNRTLITDATILAAFRFDDLRVIDVSGCNLITSVGFQALAMQNRRIEELTASSCTGLENEGLTVLACYLQRLSHLNIESCEGIRSLAMSFNDIKEEQKSVSSYFDALNPPNQFGLPGCKILQYLNVSNCVGMNINSIATFIRAFGKNLKIKMDSIPLKEANAYRSTEGSYATENSQTEISSKPPPPPPPPPSM